MWAIDMTDVFVICKFTPSPSVLRTATSPSQEGEALLLTSNRGVSQFIFYIFWLLA